MSCFTTQVPPTTPTLPQPKGRYQEGSYNTFRAQRQFNRLARVATVKRHIESHSRASPSSLVERVFIKSSPPTSDSSAGLPSSTSYTEHIALIAYSRHLSLLNISHLIIETMVFVSKNLVFAALLLAPAFAAPLSRRATSVGDLESSTTGDHSALENRELSNDFGSRM